MLRRRGLAGGFGLAALLAALAWGGLLLPAPIGDEIGLAAATPSSLARGAGAAAADEGITQPSVGEPSDRAAGIGVEMLGSGLPPARPAQPVMVAAYRTALLADHCVDRDLPAPPASDVILTVLDRTYALPADLVPPDLVSAAAAGFAPDQLVRAVLVDDLAALRAAAMAAGHQLIVDSAYRSYAAQAATFDRFVATYGYAEALVRAARPGHSEHQLGTAFDFTSAGWEGRVGDWAVESAAGAWMAEHAWEYGFVMSYPAGSQAATCFTYEPWHYRWIGREAAAAQRASGEPLRTFLLRHVGG